MKDHRFICILFYFLEQNIIFILKDFLKHASFRAIGFSRFISLKDIFAIKLEITLLTLFLIVKFNHFFFPKVNP